MLYNATINKQNGKMTHLWILTLIIVSLLAYIYHLKIFEDVLIYNSNIEMANKAHEKSNYFYRVHLSNIKEMKTMLGKRYYIFNEELDGALDSSKQYHNTAKFIEQNTK